MANCRLCGASVETCLGFLKRMNETGVDGIWECRPCCNTTQSNEQSVLQAISGDETMEASYHDPKWNTWFDQYSEFADAMSIPQGNILQPGTVYNAMDLARKLILEEGNELFSAHTALTNGAYTVENLVELADACADLIYVTCQMARAADIPLNAVFAAVHRNNMTKLGPDGKPVRREDGKILKPEGYVPVTKELWEILNKHHTERSREQGAMGAENWKGE